jgi:hypothetical protein
MRTGRTEGPRVSTLHRTDRDENTLPVYPLRVLCKPAFDYIRTTRYDELRVADLLERVHSIHDGSKAACRQVRLTFRNKPVILEILLLEYVAIMERTFYCAVEAGDHGKRNTQAFLYVAECMSLDSLFNLVRWCYSDGIDLTPWRSRIDHYEYLSRREQGCKAAELVTLAIRGLFFSAITEDAERIRVRVKELRRVVDNFL